jgi:hypothetical protein
MAGTTRLELATSAVTVQRPEVTSCNFTAPIATLGAVRNPWELLLHPNCTQILICDDVILYLDVYRGFVRYRMISLCDSWQPDLSERCPRATRFFVLPSFFAIQG